MEYTPLLGKIHRIGLFTLVFLFPLWFLPFTQDILNVQKQVLLIILVLVSLIAWCAKTINEGEFSVYTSWVHWLVGALVGAGALSTFFSLWRYGSFWGWPLNPSESFLTLLFFVLVYFLVSQTIKTREEFIKLFLLFATSMTVAGVFIVLQLYHVFIIPFSFARNGGFNTIGSVNLATLTMAVLVPLLLAFGFGAHTKRLRTICWSLAAVLFAILLLMNFSRAWIALAAGLCVVLALGFMNVKRGVNFRWISLPMALLVIALFFLIFHFSLPFAPPPAVEILPSFNAELGILKSVFAKSFLFGTGPATFAFDYAQYHGVSLNQTLFWGTRFASGTSEIIDWFITYGLLGGFALVALLGTAVFFALRLLIRPREDNPLPWMMGLGLTASFIAVIVAQILYYSNFTLSFLFWLLLAGLARFTAAPEKKISLAPSSWKSVVSSFAFLAILIGSVGLVFMQGQKYVADLSYVQGATLISRGEQEKGVAKILSAAALNPGGDLYWRNLSQVYLSQLNQIIGNKTLTTEQKQQQSQAVIANTAAAANQAIIVNPANVENWNVRGFIYRNLIGFPGADDLAIDSYSRASALEPASPFSLTELARAYLAQAQNLGQQKDTTGKRQEALDKALDNLNAAITLKNDYAPAHYLIAVLYDLQGKSDQAIAKLEETKKIAPQDIGLAFQLGVIYYQKNQIAKAQQEFERAKSLNEGYANARYMLGLVYDKEGQKNKAIVEFQKVLELNPDNDQVKKIISNLIGGKPALNGLQPAQPPVQENPPELKK